VIESPMVGQGSDPLDIELKYTNNKKSSLMGAPQKRRDEDDLSRGQSESADFPCSLPASSIPTGLCNSAQGCEERATLGKGTEDSQPQRGCGTVLFPWSPATTLSGLYPVWRAFSQGSSFLATLGFVAESLRDSALKNASLHHSLSL